MCGSLRLKIVPRKTTQVGDPHDGQPQIHVPFRLGVFLRLGDAEEIAGRGEHDEDLVAPEDEPGELAAEEPRAGRALHDVEARRDQRVAAEGEDHRGGVERAEPAEGRPRKVEVEGGIGELERDIEADEEAGEAPEHRRDHAGADDVVHVAVRLLAKRDHPRRDVHRLQPPDHAAERDHARRAPCGWRKADREPWRRRKSRRARSRQEHPGLHHRHWQTPVARAQRQTAAYALVASAALSGSAFDADQGPRHGERFDAGCDNWCLARRDARGNRSLGRSTRRRRRATRAFPTAPNFHAGIDAERYRAWLGCAPRPAPRSRSTSTSRSANCSAGSAAATPRRRAATRRSPPICGTCTTRSSW